MAHLGFGPSGPAAQSVYGMAQLKYRLVLCLACVVNSEINGLKHQNSVDSKLEFAFTFSFVFEL